MISRRDFFKAVGVALFATQIPGFTPETRSNPDFDALYGRVLTGDDGLWTNSIVHILDSLPDSYLTPYGRIPRRQLQPVLTPARYQQTSFEPPFIAEVTGANATLRRWCAFDGHALESVGHGGVLRVVDRISYDGVDWYGVDAPHADGNLLWTHSAPLAPLTLPLPLHNLTLELNRAAFMLTVRQHRQPLFSAPFATASAFDSGEYRLSSHSYTQRIQPSNQLAPFIMTFADQFHLYGAYWHNNFGSFAPAEGVEVPPYVAKWLYGATQRGARVMII